MILKSHAKINLALNITGKKDNGYHLLDMVMVPLELHDTITIDFLGEGKDTYVTCDKVELSENTQYNIVSKVVKKLREKYGFNKSIQISIHKEIPVSAGMGGGSSNAATILKYLLKEMKVKLTEQELINLALEFGADVPFFIKNKPARVKGIGEELLSFDLKKKHYVLILKPERGLSTETVYKESDNYSELESADIKTLIKGLSDGDLNLVNSSIANALEKPSINLLPEIKELIDFLKKEGLPISQMTGSGSAVFAVSNNLFHLKKVAKKASKLDCDVILTKMIKE